MRGIAANSSAGLVDPHLEDVGDRLALVLHFERLRVVALALADLARHVDVGQEVHLDLDDAVALAGLAAPALDVEREAARRVAAQLGLGREREQLADQVERPGVGGRIRTRRAADRRLIDHDHLVERLGTDDPAVRAAGRLMVQVLVERLDDDLVDQRRLPAPAHAGHAGERPERNVDVDARAGCWRVASLTESVERPLRRCLGIAMNWRPERYAPVSDSGFAMISSIVPTVRMSPPSAPAPGTDVDDHVGGAHRVLIVLDHDERVADVAQRLQRRQQPVVVALVQPDRRFVEDVEHADQRRADLRRQPNALRLAARERRRASARD